MDSRLSRASGGIYSSTFPSTNSEFNSTRLNFTAMLQAALCEVELRSAGRFDCCGRVSHVDSSTQCTLYSSIGYIVECRLAYTASRSDGSTKAKWVACCLSYEPLPSYWTCGLIRFRLWCVAFAIALSPGLEVLSSLLLRADFKFR